jgi:PTH1 family peptidyl-tRNA hydrolase
MPIRCIAGLGNPGLRYRWSRHNAGFWIVDRLSHEVGVKWERRDSAFETSGDIDGEEIVLLKPQTYMNRSGEAVSACLGRHGFGPEELLVVVDDVALPSGRLRVRPSGSAGGHRGLLSIEESLESRDYARLRIGVEGDREEDEDLADYVLRPLSEDGKALFKGVIERGVEAVRIILREGLPKAMNRFNPVPHEEGERPATRAGETGVG